HRAESVRGQPPEEVRRRGGTLAGVAPLRHFEAGHGYLRRLAIARARRAATLGPRRRADPERNQRRDQALPTARALRHGVHVWAAGARHGTGRVSAAAGLLARATVQPLGARHYLAAPGRLDPGD